MEGSTSFMSTSRSYQTSQVFSIIHGAKQKKKNKIYNINTSSLQLPTPAINLYDDLKLSQIVEKLYSHRQLNLASVPNNKARHAHDTSSSFIQEGYKQCQRFCFNSSSYIGSLVLSEERMKAILAIVAWGRRVDAVVDDPDPSDMSTTILDDWENRLEDIFNGRPRDAMDAALADTVDKFCLDIQPFKDLIKGMRMDTWKCRYDNFEELSLYCYYVAGSACFMGIPVLGIAPDQSAASIHDIYRIGINYFTMAHQLTNILRDVREDALRGRVYLPQDELAQFGLCDDDVYSSTVSDAWRQFMKQQVIRARFCFSESEKSISLLDKASHWPVWTATMVYKKYLDVIEKNEYDNLTKEVYISKARKLSLLPLAYMKATWAQN